MHIASLPTPMFTLLASAAALLAGCAISTPYPQITQTKQRDPGSPIVVVITKIVISPRQRQAFNREATNVMRTLSEQPGLIGYSARRQLFGIEGWTISLWEDAAALDRFVHSDRHVRSIEASLSAIQTVSIKRLSLPLEAIPKDWPSALNLLAEPGGLRTYGW